MGYFYQNNVRKIPGPSYVFDAVWTDPQRHPGMLSEQEIQADKDLKAVEIGRYILYDPEITEEILPDGQYAYAGTTWQKVYDRNIVGEQSLRGVCFALVADQYTNPISGLSGTDMQSIWDEVWNNEEV